MPYWIFEDGEMIGPMQAIEVLRRARPSTLVSDGQRWFRLDEDGDVGNPTASAAAPQRPERLVIRTGLS